MKNIVIILALVALSLTACATEQTAEEPVMVNKYFMFESQDQESNVQIMELRLLRAERETTPGEFDKDDFDDLDRNLERFFPETLVVEQGDTVAIAFNTEKPNFITVNGVGYSAKAGTYIFKAEKKGSYEIECLDCADRPTALIRVV